MKKLNAGLLTGLIILMSSCVMTKTYTTEEKKMRIENGDEKVFVVTNGEKISGKKISRPSIWDGRSSWIKIDDQKIDGGTITAFQDKNASFAKFGTPDKWRWVKQLKRGKVNLYYYEIAGHKDAYSSTPSEQHFVFQEGSGELLELSITEIANILKDNKKAYDTFTSQFGSKERNLFPKQLQNHPKVLFEAIDIYNGTI